MRSGRRIACAAVIVLAGVLAAACPRPNGYVAERVFPNVNMDGAVGLHTIPGETGYAAVVTQEGVIYRVNLFNRAEPATVFLDLSSRIIDPAGDEEGLLGVAFAPDYPASRRLYVYYSAFGDGDPSPDGISRVSVLSRFNGADPGSERVILTIPQPFANHNGGGLAFGPDNMLYVALGDGGSGGDPFGHGQDTNTLLGSILRLDVSGDTYTSPSDNPLVGAPGADEIWAWGFRNPWRITFDPGSGELWTGDVGQGAVEEVDRVVRGGNYGWNILEGDQCYRATTCNAGGTILPRAAYSHEFGCSVTGGYVYRGVALPELSGWYIYGDFCTGRVWAVDAGSGAGAAIPLADTGLPISSFAQTPDGEVYIVSYSGGIYRLAPK